MSEAGKKPDLREQLGVAMNASALAMQRSNQETPLTRIAALGAAALTVQLSADVENVPIGGSRSVVYGAPLDERDVLVAELAPLLWHIRYGGQTGGIPRAIELFAKWITYRSLFAKHAGLEHEVLRLAFSSRCMHEWLSDKCGYCGGSRKQERSRSGQWLRPRGSMQRNATFRPCTACSGSGRAAIRHPERMKVLGLTREQYEEQRWQQRFNAAMTWLGLLVPSRLVRSLTAQLERGKRSR